MRERDHETGPYLRIHLIDGDHIDLEVEHERAGIALAEATSIEVGSIGGRHVGGHRCRIPRRSVLWVELVDD